MTEVWVLSTLVKVTVILAIGLGALRRSLSTRAAVRHAVLAGLLGIAAAMPVATLVLPAFEMPVRVSAPPAPPPLTIASAVPDSAAPRPVSPVSGTVAFGRRVPAIAVLLLIVGAGALVALTPLVVGLWHSRRLCAAARAWPEGQAVLDRLASQAGMGVHVRVRMHHAVPGPVTCGARHPLVIFPDDVERWPESDLERAAVHELEHIQRRDWLIDVIARVICAIYWFHPLVWRAWRHLRLESERAADDAVVRSHEATAYAELLVTLADRLVARPTPLLAMASRRDLPVRVRSLLDESRGRGRAGRGWIGGTAIAAAAVVLGTAPLTAGSRAVAMPRQTAAGVIEAPVVSDPTIRFEVASIKRNVSGGLSQTLRTQPAGDTTAVNMPLFVFFARAWGTYAEESGLPGWVRTQRYDVTVKVPARTSPRQVSEMWRNLFAERTKMAAHLEPRNVPSYALVAARPDRQLGPQLRPATIDCEEAGSQTVRSRSGDLFADAGKHCDILSGSGRLVSGSAPLDQLASMLRGWAGRPVTNSTGLEGRYAIDLRFSTQPPAGGGTPGGVPDAPEIFTAVQEQLGLKLQPSTTTVQILVIDHIEPPTEN